MANYTTNLNLKKPTDLENYDVGDQNGNMDLIDAYAGTINEAVSDIEDGIAYRLGNTNTTGATLAVGTYVYVTGNTNSVADGMYKVTTAIAANGSITTSNVTAVPGGISNALNSNIRKFDTKVLTHGTDFTVTPENSQTILEKNCTRHGDLYVLEILTSGGATAGGTTHCATLTITGKTIWTTYACSIWGTTSNDAVLALSARLTTDGKIRISNASASGTAAYCYLCAVFYAS